MKNKKNVVFLLWVSILTVVVSLCVAGCSKGPGVKHEKEIIADIAAHDFFAIQYSEYRIRGLEVLKRQTDIDNKLDVVYAVLDVINSDESIEGKVDIKITYGLYNEGWILDECEPYFDGENNGSYFTPLSFPVLTIEDVKNDIALIIGQDWTNVEIAGQEWNEELFQGEVNVSGNEIGTYLFASNEAILYYTFDQTYGTWWCSDVSMKNREEKWNIVGIYGIDTRNRDGIEIVWNTIEVGLPVHYFDMNDADYSGDYAIADICNIHSEDFTKFLSEALTEWKNRSFSEISDYGYTVEITGDFYSLEPFEYAVYWDGGGNRCDHMLFLGKNDIAYFWANDFEDDWYQRRAILDVYSLVPIY